MANARTVKKPKVVVGALADWPVGRVFGELVGLPKWTNELGCFLAVGVHAKDASATVFRTKETISNKLKPYESRILAGLDIVSPQSSRYGIRSYKSTYGFHANMTVDELRRSRSRCSSRPTLVQSCAPTRAPSQ